MPERFWPARVALLIGVGVAAYAIVANEPPAAEPADSPRTVFSAARAMEHVEAIAQKPHPSGSVEGGRVREVILERLRAMGLEPEVQAPRDEKRTDRNVVARLKGRGVAGKKALLLCAHYDSVAEGPGAGDDASGVAVILETLRALQAGAPLERDLLALIDDGEENGLWGASAFVEEHPWAKDIGVVLNFDARGTRGPSFMFETSERNGWLVRRFAEAAPHPLATSLSMEVYRLMPNDTDLTIFKRAGFAGLNFAFTRGVADYHTARDTPANLDLRSLQHQGENALAMASHLADLDLEDVRGDDVVYFSALNRFVFVYPQSLARPLALAPAVAWLLAALIGLARRRVKVGGLVVGLFAWPAALVASTFVAGAAWLVVRDQFQTLGIRPVDVMMPVLVGLGVIAALTTLVVERWAAKGRSVESMALGALAWWALLAGASAYLLPGASYIFTWPAAAGLLGMTLAMMMPKGSALAMEATLLGCLPALILMPPLIRDAFDGLGLRFAAPLMFPVVLFVGGVLPLLGPFVQHRRSVA